MRQSTLVEGIAVAAGFNRRAGTTNLGFATRAESMSRLSDLITLVRASEVDRLDAEPQGGPRVIDSNGGVSLHEARRSPSRTPTWCA